MGCSNYFDNIQWYGFFILWKPREATNAISADRLDVEGETVGMSRYIPNSTITEIR